jgi:hypothetical protein
MHGCIRVTVGTWIEPSAVGALTCEPPINGPLLRRKH